MPSAVLRGGLVLCTALVMYTAVTILGGRKGASKAHAAALRAANTGSASASADGPPREPFLVRQRAKAGGRELYLLPIICATSNCFDDKQKLEMGPNNQCGRSRRSTVCSYDNIIHRL